MNKSLLIVIHGILFAGLSALAMITDGSGGGGDSLTHFFFSEMAWEMPVYLLDLWAKPIFTLVSSPFAQLGFIGIKLFNILCGVLASYLTCLTALQLKKGWAATIPMIAFLAPAFYTYLFSGLTEPFAALIVITAVYLCLSKRVTAGFIVASLLPFIRTEAQVFLLLFGIFGVLNGHWKNIPWLLFGYFVYSFIGWMVLDNPLWIFDHPYNAGGSAYGSGNWTHYLDRLFIMLAAPGMILAGLGLIDLIIRFIKREINWRSELILVHGVFFALLIGHSVVWALGIYGSAGLERTLITVFPLLWLIMLDGLNMLRRISSVLTRGRDYALPVVFLVTQIIVLLTSGHAKYYFYNHLRETSNNAFYRDDVAPFILNEFQDAEHFMMSDPYMALPLGENYKNPKRVSTWSLFNHPEAVPEKTVYLFDNYYVPVHDGVSLEQLQNSEYVREVRTWKLDNGQIYSVYVKQGYQP